MRVLVIGATGLLGGRISEYLSNCGYKVISGIRDPKKESFLKKLHTEIAYIDLEELKETSIFPLAIDFIIYAAGMNSSDSALHPIRAMNIRGDGTKNLIDLAAKNKVRKFIYISSAHIYKSPLLGDFDESTPLFNDDAYAKSHKVGERAVLEATSLGLIDGLVLRVSNSFGYPIDRNVNCWDLLVNNLCKQVIETGAIQLKGDGTQLRNFISIEDVCRAISHFLSKTSAIASHEQFRVINVGSKSANTILEMATLVGSRFKELMKIKPKIHLTHSMNSKNNHESINFLDYKTNLLNCSGFEVSENFNKEIDSLIHFCSINFDRNEN